MRLLIEDDATRDFVDFYFIFSAALWLEMPLVSLIVDSLFGRSLIGDADSDFVDGCFVCVGARCLGMMPLEISLIFNSFFRSLSGLCGL